MAERNAERAVMEHIRDAGTDGRAIAIAELLRMGWPVAKVVAAVKLADQGHIEPAIDALLRDR